MLQVLIPIDAIIRCLYKSIMFFFAWMDMSMLAPDTTQINTNRNSLKSHHINSLNIRFLNQNYFYHRSSITRLVFVAYPDFKP